METDPEEFVDESHSSVVDWQRKERKEMKADAAGAEVGQVGVARRRDSLVRVKHR